jgi:putative peptide zinc metalloprotease protein
MDTQGRRLVPTALVEVDAVKTEQQQGRGQSPYWYRVEEIQPAIRGHAQIHRHRYRGEIWYVLEDPTAERFHRFTPAIYEVLQFFDGERTVEEIHDLACEVLGDEAPTQHELIDVLAQLHSADALSTQVEPDTDVFLERMAKMKRMKLVGQLVNPLFLKIPLFDPERITVWGMRFLKPLFSQWGFVLWAAITSVGFYLTALHWEELSANIFDRVLAEENLVLMWFVFPVVKALHEMGHALMTKAFGGESHEMGVMLLLLMPLPYIDASSASRFRKRRERVLVGFAGMMVEMLLGTIALLAWVNLEPGMGRSIAYNVFFTAGVSTIIFNLNPLLRYDGYYILADMLEIPNLRAKSMNYLLYLLERYIFKVPDRESPALNDSERNWLAVYAPCSLCYRALVITGIIWAIATQFFFVGIVIGITTAVAWVVVPLFKSVKYLKDSPRLRPVRARALSLSGGFLGCLILGPMWVPIPLNSMTEGVVWLPEESLVRSGVGGWVAEELAGSSDAVVAGQPVMRLEDPTLEAQIAIAEAKEEELLATIQSHRPADVVAMEVVRERLETIQVVIAELREDQENLTVRVLSEGRFNLTPGPEHEGRFVQRGEVLGTVLGRDSWQVLVLAHQDEIDLIRGRSGRVEVRFADQLEQVYEAVVTRQTPTATKELPSGAFATQGGGEVTLDPMDPNGRQAFERWFQLDLEVPHKEGRVRVGGRVFVRFNHGYEPLAKRWGRAIRRVFLSEFDL